MSLERKQLLDTVTKMLEHLISRFFLFFIYFFKLPRYPKWLPELLVEGEKEERKRKRSDVVIERTAQDEKLGRHTSDLCNMLFHLASYFYFKEIFVRSVITTTRKIKERETKSHLPMLICFFFVGEKKKELKTRRGGKRDAVHLYRLRLLLIGCRQKEIDDTIGAFKSVTDTILFLL